MARAPLSIRNNPEALEGYTALHDDIPEWLKAGARRWCKTFFFDDKNWPWRTAIENAEQHLRLRLLWVGNNPAEAAGFLLLNEIDSGGSGGLDLIDYCLSTCRPTSTKPKELQEMLDRSGSAWTVGKDADGVPCLERRVDPTAEIVARSETEQAGNAAIHLRSAWHLAYGRDPNPSAAYRDAIRAVEAAARPVVTPNDALATLGKMNSAIRDAPQKWVTDIGDIDTVLKMMETVWKAQHDRHGTDEAVPVTVTQAEAEAALNIAVALVQMFRTGGIRLATTP